MNNTDQNKELIKQAKADRKIALFSEASARVYMFSISR